jgi:hypothetical protein
MEVDYYIGIENNNDYSKMVDVTLICTQLFRVGGRASLADL